MRAKMIKNLDKDIPEEILKELGKIIPDKYGVRSERCKFLKGKIVKKEQCVCDECNLYRREYKMFINIVGKWRRPDTGRLFICDKCNSILIWGGQEERLECR
jgi:hypothetical protein